MASPALFRASWLCFLLSIVVVLVVNGLVQTMGMAGIGGGMGMGMGRGGGFDNGFLGMVIAGAKHVSEGLMVAAYGCLFASLVPPVGVKRD